MDLVGCESSSNVATRTQKNPLQDTTSALAAVRLPLLYCGDELVCVLSVAVDAEYQAAAEEAGVQLTCALPIHSLPLQTAQAKPVRITPCFFINFVWRMSHGC